jgi:hypothetical protein
LTVEEMLHKLFVSAESFCNGAFDDDLTIFAISLDADRQETGVTG